MEIILISKRSPGAYGRVHLGPRGTLLLFGLLGMMVGGLVYGAFRWGLTAEEARPGVSASAVNAELRQQRELIEQAVKRSEENLDALALRLGNMQAQLIRLDALGGRLVDLAKLDPEEFDFSAPPGRGGPENPSALQPQKVPDFLAALRDLEQEIEDRVPKLRALEGMLMNRKLQAEVHPAGSPVHNGWVSSRFGERTDPINGKLAFHEGLDISGRNGAEVDAVAAGVVVFSGRRPGYGNVVEINHGNGYSTLYAHNRRNLVRVGETVKKGERIALMGSTGRSTGRHVHFEVLRGGKPVDPAQYVQGAR